MAEYLNADSFLWPTKDADSLNDFGIDWSDMAPADDSISNAVWTAPPDSVTITGIRNDGLVSYAFIGGGVPGAIHEIEVTATTAQGRILNRTMRLGIMQKKE